MHVRIELAGSDKQVEPENPQPQADDLQVSVWSMHLEHRSYGPYAAQNKLVVSEDQVNTVIL